MQDRLLEMYMAAQKRLKVAKDADKLSISSGKSEIVSVDIVPQHHLSPVSSAVQNMSSVLPIPPQPAAASHAPKGINTLHFLFHAI